MLDRGSIRAALIIPRHFESEIRRGRPTEAQVLVDATDGNTAKLTRGNAGQITRAFSRQIARDGTAATIRTSTRLWFNPGRESRKFYGPGFLVLGLSIFPTVIAALAMAREGEQQTILELCVSSISATEYLIGQILAAMAVGVTQCSLGVTSEHVRRCLPCRGRRAGSGATLHLADVSRAAGAPRVAGDVNEGRSAARTAATRPNRCRHCSWQERVSDGDDSARAPAQGGHPLGAYR